MEEVKTYIESGILELYVLRHLTDQENKEVEAMSAKYPEIQAEILAIEKALEAFALQNVVAPPSSLGDKILAQLNNENTLKTRTKIVPMYNNVNDVRVKALHYALVACIVLLVVSVAIVYSLYNQLNSANQQIASLTSQKEQLVKNVSRLRFDKAGMENQIAMTETQEWKTIKLAGVKNSPHSKMLVYWNKRNNNVLINYSAIDLPKPDQRHEYQLWAIVEGKPVSLGIFTANEKATEAVKQMDRIANAQAFAVTIEPKGGSINPTMENMVVMGAI